MGMPRVIKKGLKSIKSKKSWNNKSELRTHPIIIYLSIRRFNILISLRKTRSFKFLPIIVNIILLAVILYIIITASRKFPLKNIPRRKVYYTLH